MNNLDKILSKIIDDANEKCGEIKKEADAEVHRIIREAEARAADIRGSIKRETDKECRDIISRAESSAKMKKREAALAARTALIDQAYIQAFDYIKNMTKSEYRELLSGVLANAVIDRLTAVCEMKRLYGDEEEYSLDFELVMSKLDRGESGDIIINKAKELLMNKSPVMSAVSLKLSDITAELGGGFILRYGDIETNCSISSMLKAAREENERDVIRILFQRDE